MPPPVHLLGRLGPHAGPRPISQLRLTPRPNGTWEIPEEEAAPLKSTTRSSQGCRFQSTLAPSWPTPLSSLVACSSSYHHCSARASPCWQTRPLCQWGGTPRRKIAALRAPPLH
ncbi:hypothetical protein NDU88_003786 [Pleurodeles waltl]|uniref:Uncharacterized protein n=1 Tax=Pleurodeles waltl TaxID=8319 RepID=A0AAV7M6E0_PLEWA|nr:hypothetical protein NDU88_003786 [Pleurodeles waltl]